VVVEGDRLDEAAGVAARLRAHDADPRGPIGAGEDGPDGRDRRV
jgi:hypothetical protein